MQKKFIVIAEDESDDNYYADPRAARQAAMEWARDNGEPYLVVQVVGRAGVPVDVVWTDAAVMGESEAS